MKRLLSALLLPSALAMAGCGFVPAPSGGTDSPVGDMSDTSYYGQRGVVSRPNARGRPVSLDSFEGRFVWSEYAAPWCSPCLRQTPEMRSVEGSFRDVVFLTIMTSDMGGYGDPPTIETAGSWAQRFGLDPERVLAADLTSMKIPKHILFSPDGHVLFERTGLMTGDEIRSTLTRYIQDWQDWKRSAKPADWMARR